MNCPTCTALACLLHSSTWRCVHGHEFQRPKSGGVSLCLKCNRKPPRAGQWFCHQCEMRNAKLGIASLAMQVTRVRGTC